MLTVKLVYKLSSVPDDLKWAKNTHMTPFTLTFKEGITNDIYAMVFEDFFTPSTSRVKRCRAYKSHLLAKKFVITKMR